MILLVSQNEWQGWMSATVVILSTATHATFPCGLTARSTLGHRRAEADSDKLGLFQLNSEPWELENWLTRLGPTRIGERQSF